MEIDVLTLADAGVKLMFSPKKAADFLGVSPDQLEKYRAKGKIAPRRPLEEEPKAIFYTLPDLLEFIHDMKPVGG